MRDDGIQFGQQIDSRRCDMGPDHSAVVKIALLAEKFLRLKPGEQTSDVRHRGDHHAADGRTGEASRTRCTQDPQDIELGQGQAGWLEALLHAAMQAVG